MHDATDWLEHLRRAIAADPRGITGVAQRLGYSRPAISRVLSGTYGDTSKIADAVMGELVSIECPYLGTAITAAQCRGYASRSYPAITALEVPHWRACRRCPHNRRKRS